MKTDSVEAMWLGFAGFRKLHPSGKELEVKLKQIERGIGKSNGVITWEAYAILMVLARRGIGSKAN